MTRSKARWLLVVGAVIIWVFAIYPAYYVVHKPVSAANLYAVASAVGDLLTWALILAVAAAFGSRLTRRLSYASLLERITFSIGLGLGIFSVLTLALGLLGFLYRWLFWALLLVVGLLLWRELHRLGRALWKGARQWEPPWTAWSVFLSLFLLAILALTLLTALLPPTEWDSLVYHLVGPERYLQAHRIVFDFDNYYLFFPSFVEMLFTLGMALKGDVVPRLIHFSYLLLTIGALSAFVGRFWKNSSGLVAAVLFLSIPTAVQIASWSYVDLALTFYSFTALYALLSWLTTLRETATAAEEGGRHSDLGWLILSGLFCGAGLSIKYTGVVCLVMLGAVLLWELLRRRLTFRRFLGAGLVVSGLALVVAAPWYIKNVIVAGNPVYPLLFGGKEWNEIATRWLLVPGQEMSILDLLVVPWTLTVLGKQGTVAYDATYSPLFLMLLPLLLIVPRRARGLTHLLLVAGVGYIFWIVSGAASYGTFILRGRQVLPIFAPLSLLCAYSLAGMEVWDRRNFSLQRVLKLVVVLTLLFGLVSQMLLTISLNPLPYLVGQQSRGDYLDQYTSHRLHQAINYMNHNLTEQDKVLFIWEPRGYGIKIDHQADVLLDNFAQQLDGYGSPEAVLTGLHQEGFSHILVNHFVYPWIISDFPIAPQEQAGWETFRNRYLTEATLVHREGEYLSLYRLLLDTGP
jgi:hypothetical protein